MSDETTEREKYEIVWQHDEYRKFSPGERAGRRFDITRMLKKGGVKTVLDAGCGSGKLLRQLMEDGSFDVHGFDIASNCLDPFFDQIKDSILTIGSLWNKEDFSKPYDAIICTDVLEHIPPEHVSQVLENLNNCTRRLCYLAIALFPDGFGEVILKKPLHLTVRPASWWLGELQKAGFSRIHHLVETNQEGEEIWLHAFLAKPPTS